MFDPFAIKGLLRNPNNDDTNETNGFREPSTSDASSGAVEKGAILPNINDRKKNRKSSSSNPKPYTNDYTIKFPVVNFKRENLPIIEDVKNCNGILYNNFDGRTTKAERQKLTLEESLKRSLKNYSHPKFYMEGESKSTHHLMLEMNEFYLEMAEQLRYLKSGLSQKPGANTEEVDRLRETPSNYEIELDKLISSIEEDDQKVAENIKTLKEVKEERNIIQQEIQSLSGESDQNKETTQDKGDNKLITYLLAPEVVGDLNNVEQNDKEPDDGNNKKKNVQIEGKNFIAKNKELAKEYNMSKVCLTDEEKRKLQLLLSDIDVCEDRCEEIENCTDGQKSQLEEVSEVKQIKEEEEVGEQDFDNPEQDDQKYNSDMCVNGFKLDANDTEILNNLDLKINFLRADGAKDEIQQAPETDDYKSLEAAETKGKRWKFQLLQKRLKSIDKYLAAIRLQKEKERENEKTEESENEILIDVAHIKEEYQKSVCDMSVDIGELEFQEAKELEELNDGVADA